MSHPLESNKESAILDKIRHDLVTGKIDTISCSCVTPSLLKFISENTYYVYKNYFDVTRTLDEHIKSCANCTNTLIQCNSYKLESEAKRNKMGTSLDGPLAIGDGVRLKTERGPVMSVEEIIQASDDSGIAYVGCCWFDENNVIHRERFDSRMLMVVVRAK